MILILILSLTSIAAPAGTVESKMDEHKALVKIEGEALNVGDKVTVFKNSCSGVKVQLCKKIKSGDGTIIKVRQEKHYEVHFDEHITNINGMIIERQ